MGARGVAEAGDAYPDQRGHAVAGPQGTILGTPLDVVTARDGRYTLGAVPPREVVLSARAPLYRSSLDTVRLGPGDSVQVDFVLHSNPSAIIEYIDTLSPVVVT